MTYYNTLQYGPVMLGEGAWQEAQKESKRLKPGLNRNARNIHARKLLRKYQEESDNYSDYDDNSVKNIQIITDDEDDSGSDLTFTDIESIKPKENPFYGEDLDFDDVEFKEDMPRESTYVDPEIIYINPHPVGKEAEDLKNTEEYLPTDYELNTLIKKYKYCDYRKKLKECLGNREAKDLLEFNNIESNNPILYNNPIVEEQKSFNPPILLKKNKNKNKRRSNVRMEGRRRRRRKRRQNLPPLIEESSSEEESRELYPNEELELNEYGLNPLEIKDLGLLGYVNAASNELGEGLFGGISNNPLIYDTPYQSYLNHLNILRQVQLARKATGNASDAYITVFSSK